VSLARHIVFSWFFFLPTLLIAQTEAEIKENAEQLFLKEQYVDATPMYLRLLSLQPRDYDYNYKYGTCLLFNSNKKQDAIRYLTYSVTSESIDPNAHFFLARAYHLNYQFNDAIKEYQKYQTIAGVKGKYTSDAVRNIEMCRNGKKLLSTITEIIVTKKSEIKSEDFFRIYDLANIGGSFVVAADFQSKMDKKMNHIPLVHFPQGTNLIFYSSYGENTQKDIYMVRRLPDGKFSLPQLIVGGVNSPFEEDYPYMHPNGRFLYFSSKGHNSMGGFDVFRSLYDAENNSFGPPENIDFAISSPDDDILYVVDKDDKNAYFASSRQSQNGKLFVYQVKVDRVPIQLAVVKGTFESGVNPANKGMTVEVIDKLSDKNIGTFKTNPKGTYLVTFPKGGKYEYHVSVDGSNESFTCQVEIPYLKEFKPLKQKMLHEVVENKETVRIVNLFNEEVEDAQAIIAQVLKDRSDLNVNVDNFDADELENLKETKKVLAEIGASELSVFEVGQLLQRRSAELAGLDQGISKEQNAVNAIVVAKVKRIKEIDKEVKELVKEAEQSESDVVQHSVLMEAKQLINERNALTKSIAETEKVGKEIDGGEVSKADQQKFAGIQEQFNSLLESGKENEALKVIQGNVDLVKNVLQGKENQHEAELIAAQKEVEAKINQQKNVGLTFEKDIDQIQADIRTLEEKKGNVKEKFRADIQNEIDYKKQQLEEFKSQRDVAQAKQIELAEERKAITDELELIRSIQNYSGADVSTTQANKAKSELGNENAKTLAQYVNSQIAELVKNNPALENSKGNLSESGKLIAIHNSKAEAIIGDESLSESERQSLLKQLNTSTLNQLQERYIEAKAALKEDKFNEALAKEVSANEQFSAKLKLENETGHTLTSSNYSASDVEKDLMPNYQSEIEEITQNSNYSEQEKWNALNKADKEFVSSIASELTEVEKGLTKEPSNQTLIAKKKALETKQAELSQAINERETKLAALVNQPELTESTVIASVSPSYESKKNAINAGTTDLSELKELQNLDTDFLAQLNESFSDIQEKLEQQPSDAQLMKESAILTSLIEKTENEINERKTKIDQIGTNQVVETPEKSDAELKNELLSSIPIKIDQEIAAINNGVGSQEEKQQAIIDKHSEYLAELEKVKSSKENKTDSESQREGAIIDELIQSEKAIIEQLKSEQVTTISVELATKEEVKNAVNASYEIEIKAIQSAQLSESEKNEQLLIAEKSFLTQLENTLSAKEKELKRDAENPVLKNEVQLLQELLEEQENRIESLEQKNTIAVAEIPTKESVMAEVDPSFKSDIAKIEKTKGPEKYTQLIAREQELQTNLEAKIADIQSTLSNDPSNENLKAELDVVTEQYQESISRVNEYALEKANVEANTPVDSKEMIANLRSRSLPEDQQDVVTQNFKTLDELKAQDAILAEYELKITQQLDELKQLNEASETKKRTQEIDILEKELATVQKKRRSVSVSIGEIEQSSIVITEGTNEEKMESLKSREAELQAQLSDSDLTPKEKKSLEKELAVVANEKAGIENPVVEEKIDQNKEALSQLIENEKTHTSEAVKEQLKAKEAEIDGLVKQANKEKSNLAKNYLLKEALEKQEDAKVDFVEAKVEERHKEIQESNGISVNATKAELEAKVRRFTVEIGDITQELNATKKTQSAAKNAKKESFEPTIAALESDLEVATIRLKEAELALSRVEEKETVFAKESVATEVTYDEEFQIASSEEYEQYAKAAKAVLDIENQIISFEERIAEHDAKIKKLIEEELVTGKDNTSEINENAQKIRTYSVEIGTLQSELESLKKTIKENTPTNVDEQMKFDNLVMRGVNPIKKAALALAIVPLPASGIEINAAGTTTTYTESNPIPVNVESPSGLVYRVQVGAFARPIPQDLFKEFTPVSGEKIANTNITRYMAGFFNNSDKVVDAREQIKALGYSDAFIVAYCDGKRITFGEARNLERSGECVPKGTNEIMLEVAEKTAAKMGYEDTSKVVKPVSQYAYNQAPGSAKAEPIEKIEGLFFCVQIAVHNRPVSHEQLFNLEPLMTLRLPNGQIRYSCGKFNDYEKAKVLQGEIKAKGIIDAFVTAYYNGERIGWQKGLELLEQNGTSILVTSNSAPTENVIDQQVQNAKVIEVFEDVPQPAVKSIERGIQFVSKARFEEYPRDVLNRYNAKGSFYFDASDRKVKSVIYDSDELLPRIQGFKSDIDTIYLTKEEIEVHKGNTVVIQVPKKQLDGDFADWLLKMNYRRSVTALKTGLEIRIFAVLDESLEKVKNELALFGLSMEVEHGEGIKENEEWEQQK